MRQSKKVIKTSGSSGVGLVRGKNGKVSSIVSRRGTKLKKGRHVISSTVRTNEVVR